jgi:hypothetical protein
MTGDLLSFKRNALRLGLCDEYRRRWDACRTRRELVDMALDSNGIEFVADSLAFGWGLDIACVKSRFGDFINGGYVRCGDGYTSELYVDGGGVLTLRSTLTLLCRCRLDIDVPAGFVSRVYVCGGRAVLHGGGRVEAIVYGDGVLSCGGDWHGTLSRSDVPSSRFVRGA